MKVFVAGANGAIGRPLVKALIAARHDVVGMATSAAGLDTLRNQGAEGISECPRRRSCEARDCENPARCDHR